MKKRYSPYLVYILTIRMLDEKIYYYVGAHARPSQQYLTENDILNFSGNPLTTLRQKGIIDHNDYFDRTKILFVEEYEDMDSAYCREKELILEYKDKFGSSCINKSLQDCHKKVGRRNSPESNAKRSKTMTGRKLSMGTRERMKIAHQKRVLDKNTGIVYQSLADCAKALNSTSGRISYGIVHNSPLYDNFEYLD